MRIQLCKTECCDCGHEGWIEAGVSDGGEPVEVPDAIIKEWRACWDRIEEIEKYFDERVQPQIDEAHRIRREQWRREHPEEAARDDMVTQRWARMMFQQVLNSDFFLNPRGVKKP